MTASMENAASPRSDRVKLTAGDVATLLRVHFYTAAAGWTWPNAVRTVAIIALMAFARLGGMQIVKLKKSNYRPGDRDELVVIARGIERTIPLLPPVKVAIERYLTVRPESTVDRLFLSRNGTPLQIESIWGSMNRLRNHLGTRRCLTSMLREFCLSNLHAETPAEEVALQQYLHGARSGETPVTVSAMRAILDESDPFGGKLLRANTNDAFAIDLASAFGTSLPVRLRTTAVRHPRRPIINGSQVKNPGPPSRPMFISLPENHPFAMRMLAVEWPANRRRRVAESARLMRANAVELVDLVEAGLLTRKEAMKLFRIGGRKFRVVYATLRMPVEDAEVHMANVRAASREKYVWKKSRRARSTEVDRALLDNLEALEASIRIDAQLRERTIREHFRTASGMLNRQVLTIEKAARLFGVDKGSVCALRMVLRSDVGLKSAKSKDRQARHAQSHQIVIREWDSGPAGETPTARHARLRQEHSFTHNIRQMALFKKYG